MSDAPIEVTTRYATTVDDLPSAWAFVMDHVDRVGADPSITISPFWSYSVHDMGDDDAPTPPRQFSVVADGRSRRDRADARHVPPTGSQHPRSLGYGAAAAHHRPSGAGVVSARLSDVEALAKVLAARLIQLDAWTVLRCRWGDRDRDEPIGQNDLARELAAALAVRLAEAEQAVEQRLAEIEAERDAYRARADVLLELANGGA